jgi:Uri superfamily endonuclease
VGTYIRRYGTKLAQNFKEDARSIKSFGSAPVTSTTKLIWIIHRNSEAYVIESNECRC